MADEAVPWMIGGGVRHGVEVGRLLAYVASGGSEGIIGPKDLQVRAQASVGASVRIAPGAAAILNRGAGMKYDTYAARWPAEESLAISATGASARSDMIVARIENPYQAGENWPVPTDADLAAGTAVFRRFAVISGVPANAKTLTDAGFAGYSAIPLARIDLPANTSAVTQALITDLRKLAQPKRDDQMAILAPAGTQNLTASTFTDITSAAFSVDVPAWATHVQLRAIIGGVAYGTTGQTQGTQGSLRLVLGTLATSSTGYNVSTDSRDRTVVMAGAPLMAVDAALRGTTQTLKLQGTKAGGATSLTFDTATTISIEARFLQVPESN